MKRQLTSIALCSMALLPAFAQKCVNPHFDAQRLDFRDLNPTNPRSPIPD